MALRKSEHDKQREAMQHRDGGGSCDTGSRQHPLAKEDPDSAYVMVLDCTLQSHESLPPVIETTVLRSSAVAAPANTARAIKMLNSSIVRKAVPFPPAEPVQKLCY